MDKYLGFSYRGVRLGMDDDANFKGFIINEGQDLHFVSSPVVDNEFAQIPFGEQTFYLGNTKSNRSFSLTIVLKEITLKKYREFLRWLNFDDKGTLIFDYNSNYGYNVKVEEIGEGQFDIVSCEGDDDKYNITLDVSFITTERWTARWVGDEPVWKGAGHPNNIDVDNDKGDVWVINPAMENSTFTFYNRHNVNNAIKIEFKGTMGFLGVTLNGTTGPTGTNTYFSEYGIIIGSDGAFGSASTGTGSSLQYVEIPKLILKPGETRTVQITGGWTSIKPTSYEII